MAFKGAILISYGSAIRIGGVVNNTGYADGGMFPIRKDTKIRITGVASASDGEANAYFITE